MSLKIESVASGSKADELGLLPGEKVVKINGHNISTFLDLQFYGADEELEIEILRLNGETRIFWIEDNWLLPLGIEPEEHRCRECINNCIFCFIDQMPPNERKSLYIKDDDYSFSFVFGNFITLTNLNSNDYTKIIEQRLSPLYISVHSTNPDLHKKILRYDRGFNIMERLEYLKANEIEFHTQIVVIPGYNDRGELARTLKDLNSLGECCLSIGIVPVGLTKYRRNLTVLQPVTSKEAEIILNQTENYSRTWCSDEIYLKAKKEIPEEEFYQDFPQLENGIGMIRLLLENWAKRRDEFLGFIQNIPGSLVFVSGVLAVEYIRQIVNEVNGRQISKARLQPIVNEYLGNTVTVTGLLTWTDIKKQLKLSSNERAVFCSNTFNTEGYTLDGFHQNEIAGELGGSLLIIDEEFDGWELIKT